MADSIRNLRSALHIAGWRTQEALNNMTLEDKRNTLIVELNNHSNMSISQLQGKPSEGNLNSLVGMAAIFYLLQSQKFRNLSQLKAMSDQDQRNTLIVELNKVTDQTIQTLQSKNDLDLVALGAEFYKKDNTISNIFEVHWNLNGAKILEQAPEFLARQQFDNRKSDQVLIDKFSYKKTIEKETRFEHSTSLNFSMTHEINFKAGIPDIAEVGGSTSFTIGTTSSWTHRKSNKVSRTFEKSTEVHVQPGAAILRKSSLTIAKIDVPYTMDVQLESGKKTTIKGIWHGVSMFNIQETQENIKFN